MRKTMTKGITAALLAVTLLLTSVLFLLPIAERTKVYADPGEVYESIERLQDVETDFSFDVLCGSELDADNVAAFVRVTDVSGESVALTAEKQDGCYRIYPQNAYTEGKSYFINLKGAAFKDSRFQDGLSFSVKKTETEKAVLQSAVIRVDADALLHIDADNKTLTFRDCASFAVGDVLMIPTPMPQTDGLVEAAYKVESVDGARVRFSVPKLEEVYAQLEVAKTSSRAEVKALQETQIAEQFLQNPQVEAVGKALYDMKHNETLPNSRDYVHYGNALVPASIQLKFKTLDPLDVTAKITWKITSDMKFTLSLQYEQSTQVSFFADENEKRQTTTSTGKWTITADLNYEIVSVDTKKITEKVRRNNKYAESLRSSYEADKQLKSVCDKLKDKQLSAEKRAELETQKQIAQARVDYSNIGKRFLKMQTEHAAMLEMKTVADYYKKNMKESGSVIQFVQLFFPVMPGVAFRVDVGAVLDFSVSAEAEFKLVIHSINEVGTISAANLQKDFTNSYYEVSGYLSICGKAELKIGAKLGVGVTIAGVFNMNLTAEAGVYFETDALGAVFVGNKDTLGLSVDETELALQAIADGPVSFLGQLELDVGAYYKVNYTVSLDLWIVDVTKSFTVVGDEVSFLSHKDKQAKVFRELVFEQDKEYDTLEKVIAAMDKEIEKGAGYDTTATFEIDAYTGAVTLPKVYIRTIHLDTGLVKYEAVPENSLAFVNEEQVHFEGLICFANDYYAAEIDNRLNVRIDTADEFLGLLHLPVRIVKQPVAVQSVQISLQDNTKEIGFSGRKQLVAEVLPRKATYQSYQWKIDKVEKPDGTLYTEDGNPYAYVEKEMLVVTDRTAVGAKVYLRAVTDREAVSSSVMVVDVKRIAVQRIHLRDKNYRADINVGEEMPLHMSFEPKEATVNLLHDVVVDVSVNDAAVTLTHLGETNYMLTAKNDPALVGRTVCITVTAEACTQTFFYTIGAVPIQEIVLYEDATGLPMPKQSVIHRGQTLQLHAVITPVNATLSKVDYNVAASVQNSSLYVNIDENGLLRVSENAPFGMEIYVAASAMYKTSAGCTITVEKIPVESVLLSAEQSYVVTNTILNLKAYVYPEYADEKNVQYRLAEPAAGVFISGSRIFASSAAAIGTEIKIVATVDGVESNVLVIRIIEDPDAEIAPDSGEPPAGDFNHDSQGGSQISPAEAA